MFFEKLRQFGAAFLLGNPTATQRKFSPRLIHRTFFALELIL